MQKELYLFIIWQNGRFMEKQIIADLRKKFEIFRIFEVSWKEENFALNLARFYGKKLPKGCKKEKETGAGAFKVCLVYDNNPQYADGKKSFTRYEYWHLFQMIKEPKEAEKLYRRAYRETMAYDAKGKEKPWILAANNLAVALLRRDTFDVEILKPLIDLKRKVNMVDSFNDGISITKTEVNPETIVANQLAMYIRAYNFEDASILADKLPDTERFQMIKAFANCLGGYYDYRGAATVKEGEERKKVFKLVKESSPLNNIVMCMAMETDSYNKEAEKALAELPETPMTNYMKLVIYIREKKLYEWSYDNALDFDEACKKLEAIIKQDKKYYKTAMNDGEISKEFMEYYDQGDWKLY